MARRFRKIVLVTFFVSTVTPVIVLIYALERTGQDTLKLNLDITWAKILAFYYSLLILAIVYIGVRWGVQQIKDILSLKKERTNAELRFLQTEVSPHFFFNMLNNLYGLIALDPKRARKLVLSISNMMRYSLYDAKRPQVTLSEEVACIHDFIDLQKVRSLKKVNTVFKVEIEDLELQIAPLLFLVLVENAFKHGVDTMTENAYVHMHLSSAQGTVVFEVINNFGNGERTTGGIGLKNLQRRLALLYPSRYEFHTEMEKGVYAAKLKILPQ
ncbi:sensor histidine kinase [Flagellimonas lutimaris]|uniref:Sensor histidine kinase n=1 Tax=Flagellimonas lutimaris TaxID=475082 RepID=A0A3A1NDE6_9FLAO|nr:histidine kinase [Allomuricauda lutimaris]RIV36696.1 sensor histidine kinase [Allomuricauda lutimaris]